MVAVKTRPITVAETQLFVRAVEKIWSEKERAELVDFVAHNPVAGDVIPGTGGVRKLRWAAASAAEHGRSISTTGPTARSTCCWPMPRSRRAT